MATDQSLATLIRALSRPSNDHDASRLLQSAATLLTLLRDPRNLSLLVSQVLTAPTIWNGPDNLQTSLDVLSTFNSASRQAFSHARGQYIIQSDQLPNTDLDPYSWARAVAKGADEKSPEWRHILVLGGILCGLAASETGNANSDLWRNIETALVEVTNRALLRSDELSELAAGTICLTLGHTFKHVQRATREHIRADLLLPVIAKQILTSRNGLEHGYFLGIADHDVRQVEHQRFSWSSSSPSFYRLQSMSKAPLMSSLGSLSQLWAFCLEFTTDFEGLVTSVDQLLAFSRSLAVAWRSNKISELDRAEEQEFLDPQTLNVTLPVLWQVLRSVLFSFIVVLEPVLSRGLRNRFPPGQQNGLALTILSTLRNLYFISIRLGHNSFDRYTFVYMCAIDILSKHPRHAQEFLTEIKPQGGVSIPVHPQDRCLDLFFFNTAEHFALAMQPDVSEALLLNNARPYLEAGIDPRLVESFEAAHSLVLSVFSCSQNADLVVKHAPTYMDILLSSFPENLSSRQFRLAIKTLVRIASPPNLLSQVQPLFASCVLEAILIKLHAASEKPLSGSAGLATLHDTDSGISEKSALVLTLIDSLPALALGTLQDWLPIVGHEVSSIQEPDMARTCKTRFWEVLSNGEMDVPRAELCVTWWNNRRGRNATLDQHHLSPPLLTMSGALPESSKL